MASSHVEISLSTIQEEQANIDKLIDSLLSSTATASQSGPFVADLKEINTPVTKSPTQSKRGRGRPPNHRLNSSSSPVSREASKKPFFDVVIECINKLNLQNKKLLEYVESLTKNVNTQKCVRAEANGESPQNNQILKHQESINVGVSDCLEKIEQNLNCNVLICRGPGTAEVINQVKVGSSVNYEGLKGNLCRAICGDEVTEIDIKNLRVTIWSRKKVCEDWLWEFIL